MKILTAKHLLLDHYGIAAAEGRINPDDIKSEIVVDKEKGTFRLSGFVGGGGFFFSGFNSDETAEMFADFGDDRDLVGYVNSGGGSMFEGRAIANQIRRRQGQTITVVEGLAASAASTIAIAGDRTYMEKGTRLMIHRPALATFFARADNLRALAEDMESYERDLIKDYCDKSGDKCTAEQMESYLFGSDGEGTEFDPDEAVENGLSDGYIEDGQIPDEPPEEASPSSLILTADGRQINRDALRRYSQHRIGSADAE